MAITKVSRGLLSTGIVDNSNATAITIDSSENVGIGITDPDQALEIGAGGKLKLSRADNARSLLLFTDNSNSTIQSDTDPLLIQSADRITFNTSGSNERMRIDSSGRVGIAASPADYATGTGQGSLRIGSNGHIQDDSNSTYYAHNLYYNGGWKFLDSNAHKANYILMADDGTMQFANTSNTGTSGQAATVAERMRINSDGDLLLGTTSIVYSSDERMSLVGNGNGCGIGIKTAFKTAQCLGLWNAGTSGTRHIIRFAAGSGGTEIGSISHNGSVITYGGTSDYRLKENVITLKDGLKRVKKLNPIQFDWKRTGDTSEGFIAHEIQDIFPTAVTGEKDGEEMQTVDYGKITPLLVKAIQELSAEVEELKTKLENK